MKRWRKWAWVLVPTCMSVLILLAAYAKHGVYPFGEKIAFYWDGTNEQLPYLSALRHALVTGRDVQYSLNTLFGMDLLTLFVFCVPSPVNLLLLLFPASRLPDAALLILLIKVALGAGSFAVFARRTLRADRLIAALCAMGYALMGWAVAYSYLLMWLDMLFWLPIVCACVHALIERGKVVGLTLSYFAIFWVNCYVGYMVAAFSALYCAALIAIRVDAGNWRRLLGRGAMLIASGLLAVGMVAFVILPTFLWTLEGMDVISTGFPRLGYSQYLWGMQLSSLVPAIPALMSGVNRDSFELKLFFGIAPLLLCFGLLCYRGLSARKRIVAGGGLLLLFYSLQNNWLNLAWHLGDIPTGFIFRQSFVLSFSMLALAAVMGTALRRGDAEARRAVVRASLAAAAVVLTYNGLVRTPLDFWHYSVNLALVIGGAVLLWALGGARGKRARLAVALGLTALMAADLYNNANQTFATFGFEARAPFVQAAPVQAVTRAAAQRDGDLYRVGDENQRTPNDGLLYAYPAGNHNSSTSNLHMLDFANAMGFDDAGWRYRTAYRSNIITDAVFGFRYVLPRRSGDVTYPTEQTPEGTAYQRNPNALPFLFVSPGSFAPIEAVDEMTRQLEEWAEVTLDTRAVQQALLARVAPGAACMMELTPEASDARTATYICPADGPAYVYPPYNVRDGFAVQRNDEPVEAVGGTCVSIGVARKGDRIRITTPESAQDAEGKPIALPEPTAWKLAQVDQAAFSALCADIQRKTQRVERPSDTVFAGTVEAAPGDKLFITLPYTQGWSLKVDGQPAKLERALHAFMGAEIQPGTHEILLTYTRPGQGLGMAISAACWALLAVYAAGERLLARKRASGTVAA